MRPDLLPASSTTLIVDELRVFGIFFIWLSAKSTDLRPASSEVVLGSFIIFFRIILPEIF